MSCFQIIKKIFHRNSCISKPFKPGCDLATGGTQMELIYPDENGRIYVPLEIDGTRGKTVFTATHRKAGAKIFWHPDDEFIGTTTSYHQIAISPSPGKHLPTIVDENGKSISRRFEILERQK